MRTIKIRLHDALFDQLRTFARRDDLSINQLITLALAEKIDTLKSVDSPEEQTAHINPESGVYVLSSDAETNEMDRR